MPVELEQKLHTAKARYVHIAPRKVRLVAEMIKGLPLDQAEAQLIYSSKRPAKVILKLLESAKAGALAKKLDLNKLYVKNITVDQGPILKRYLPRARGMATPIQKKMSHITVVLAEKEGIVPKFNIVKKKKVKIEKTPKVKKEKEGIKEEKIKSQEEIKPTKKESIFKRIFRRKAI
jgi:large subunit ribosomal protein L22